MNKIVISLTTVPSRLSSESEHGIKKCIDSLVNQNYDNYEIHFNIPQKHKFLDQEYITPEWLSNIEKITIFRTEDFGPLTKLLPTVQRLNNPEDIIITVDDDLIYHQDMVKEQVNNQNKWPEYCVGYDGMRSRDDAGNFSTHFGDVRDYYFTSNYRNSKVDIIQHYKSVSYKRRFFEDDFISFVNENYSWADDILVSGYMAYKKRPRFITYHPDDEIFESYEQWSQRGGALTFPIVGSTHHEYLEGCNLFRNAKIPDAENNLYKYIDTGYVI